MKQPKLILNDGGRKDAGYLGTTGDCVTRAIAIATQKPYGEIYDLINQTAKTERRTKLRKRKSSARTGVRKVTYNPIIKDLGGRWIPLMEIGSGCTTHLTPDELPSEGRYILSVSKHLVAWIDGVMHDTYDCSRGGTRCVYGMWRFENK